jgi:hypothetical protein
MKRKKLKYLGLEAWVFLQGKIAERIKTKGR